MIICLLLKIPYVGLQISQILRVKIMQSVHFCLHNKQINRCVKVEWLIMPHYGADSHRFEFGFGQSKSVTRILPLSAQQYMVPF